MGNETVELTMEFSDGLTTVSVPAGISAGNYEVYNLPVSQAISQINDIKPKLLNLDLNQEDLDSLLIEAKLAGNASLPISVAFWKHNLKSRVYSKFPGLFLLLFEGGKHGNGDITMQEFTILETSVRQAQLDFKLMKNHLERLDIESLVGAEGGFSPTNFDNNLVLENIKQVFPDGKLALDVASTFAHDHLNWAELLDTYNICSVEDPYPEEDWERWSDFFTKFGNRIMVIGDDLTVTNSDRLHKALNPKVINSIIIKPNQNGTITGTLYTVNKAKENGLKIVVSHRGEETDDDWIVDFALEVQADFVKFGGMDRGERIAKYNRLRELGME
jgi:enolase